MRLLVVLLVLAVPATLVSPLLSDELGTWWPSGGLAAAALLLTPRRHWWSVTAAVVVLMTPAVAAVYDASPASALVGTVAVLLPALVVALLLRPPTRSPGRMREPSSARYHLAALAGSLTCLLVVAALTSTTLPPSQVLQLTVASTLGSLTSFLVVLPLVAPTTGRPASGSRAELGVQRTLLVVGGFALLLLPLPQAMCAAAFPVLGWAALRASRTETMVQLFGFSVASYVAWVLGLGVLSDGSDLPPGLQPVPLHLFLASLAYLIVPLALSVERLSTARMSAVRNAAAVERMLDGTTTTLLLVTDGAGRLTRFNEGARRILGHDAVDVLGRPPTILHTHEEVARHAGELKVDPDLRSVVTEQVRLGVRRDWEFLRADGSTCTVSLGFTVVRDPDQSVALVVASGEDVTERLRERQVVEAALRREHESVLRLQEVDHVKQELVSNISHELRTPITSIAGYAELLADLSLGELNRPQRDAMARIERNALRLQTLVDDLLTMSRAEAGRLQLSRTSVDLRDVVRSAWELFEEQLRQRRLDTALVLPVDPATVLGDAGALERVVVNLVGNALKFTPDGGSVTVVLSCRPEGGVRLLVRDTGIGIGAEDQAKLFTRFFRSQQATDQAIQGTGLGLSIVQALVSQHGGQVSVRSREGEGTRVTVELPPP